MNSLGEFGLTECVVEVRTIGDRIGMSEYGVIHEVLIDGVWCAAKVPTVHNIDHQTDEPDPIRNVRPHLKECRLMSRLGYHHNVIKFLGVCILPDFPNQPAMVMEKIHHGNLHNYLELQAESATSIDLTRKRHILQGVANGLHYLHHGCGLTIVHMDLKASIVLLTENYDAKISGFRKACLASDNILASKSRYDPEYMPPEVITDSETKCNPTIDIFSFGVLALFTLNQELPKTTGNPTYTRSDSAVERRREDLLRMEQALSAEARGILQGMIVECLDNDPSKRPTSKILIEALGNIETKDDTDALQREENNQ